MSATTAPTSLHDSWQRLRQARLWHDSLSVGLITTALVINLLTLVDLLLRLHPLGYQVPVHYSSLSGFDQLGAWYESYGLVLTAIIVTAINTALAGQAFSRSRVAAFLLLLGSVVVAIFALIIANAFSSVS